MTFYAGFLFALCAATLVIVPFSTFRSIVEERTETTLELLQITALSPVQIVRGKTLSAMVQVLVYYCAIAPFIAFTALLPGFDIVHVTFSLVMLLITALCFSVVALAIGAQARNTTYQSLSSLFVIAMAFGGMMTFFGFMTAAGNSIRFDESDTWWALALVVFLGLSTGYLCEQAAIAQLTFDSDNRSTGIRLAAGAQWLLCWIGLLTFLIVRQRPPMPSDALTAILTLTATYITVAGLLFVSAPDSLSRRVSRGLPRSRALRVLWAPFLPGAARGLLYALMSLVLLAFFVTVLLPQLTHDQHLERSASHSIRDRPGCLFADLSRSGHAAGATAAARGARHPFVSGTRDSGTGEPALDRCGRSDPLPVPRVPTPQLFDVVNPVMTLRTIADADRGSVDAVACLVVAAGVAMAANVSALWRGVRDIVNDPVRAQIESQPQPAGIVD